MTIFLGSISSYSFAESSDYCSNEVKSYVSKYSCFSREHARLLVPFKIDDYTAEEYFLLSELAFKAAAYAELYANEKYAQEKDGDLYDEYLRISQYMARVGTNHLANYLKIKEE